jgi:hypothetical protein
VVPRGTTFAVRIEGDLAGDESKVGQRIKGTVVSNLKGDIGTIPCAGWKVTGTVAGIVPPQAKNVPGSMVLSFDVLHADDGRVFPIDAEATVGANKTTARNVGIVAGSAVAGAILGKQLGNKSGKNAAIGGVVGGAAGAVGASQAKGNHARIKKGEELEASLAEELRVPKDEL